MHVNLLHVFPLLLYTLVAHNYVNFVDLESMLDVFKFVVCAYVQYKLQLDTYPHYYQQRVSIE